MAKTDGRGNPPWTRDETILALDLFFDAGFAALPDSDERVVALSETLRALPGSEQWSANPTFRNASGVSFKLSNLQSVATGRGFSNVSTMDKIVWAQFANRRQRIKELAALIRTYALTLVPSSNRMLDDEEFAEGSILTNVHRRIERNRRLRDKVIRDRRVKNLLRCDACFKINPTADPGMDDAIFDVHHLAPLSAQGVTRTRVRDVALLCANCHRLIHRLIARTGIWMSVVDLRDFQLSSAESAQVADREPVAPSQRA